MGTGAPPILRIPLILLTMANLVLLGMRVWPWQEVLNMPSNGVAVIDPAACLVAYLVLIFWIGGSRELPSRKALGWGSLLGVIAGAVLVGQVLFLAQPANAENAGTVSLGLLGAAAFLWAVAGLAGSRLAGSTGMGILTGLWCAMISGLIACTAIMVQLNFASALPVSQDPWKQYEGLAVGSQALQELIQSLNSATWFLLIGPLVGGAVGWLFSLAGGFFPVEKA